MSKYSVRRVILLPCAVALRFRANDCRGECHPGVAHICGAGMAGLAAAGSLAPHHRVTVLKHKREPERGANGTNLKPNASLVALELLASTLNTSTRWAETLVDVPCCQMIERSAEDGVVHLHISVDAPAMFGAP